MRVCKHDEGHVETEKHNWDDGLEIAPTCQEGGKTIYTCKSCGYSEERDIVEPDPSAHEPGPSVQENRVNTTSKKIGGYDLVKRCTVCGEVINSTHVVIPKLEEDEYNIDIKTKVEGSDTETGGTVTGGKDKGKKGERYKLTARPNSGFELLYWLIGAVYLRTGSLWPTIIGHWSVDAFELIRVDLSGSGGVMTGMGIGDWITIVAGVFGAFWALRLVNPKYYDDIMSVWSKKWNKESYKGEGVL